MKRHLYALYRSAQLHFRAETFGLYFPSPPDVRPWWNMSPIGLLLLFKQARSYRGWVISMRDIQLGGAHEWWARQWPAIDMDGEYLRGSAGEAI